MLDSYRLSTEQQSIESMQPGGMAAPEKQASSPGLIPRLVVADSLFDNLDVLLQLPRRL